MAEIQGMQENEITLNIGGMKYVTSKLTVTKVKDSMLDYMFSGRHSPKLC